MNRALLLVLLFGEPRPALGRRPRRRSAPSNAGSRRNADPTPGEDRLGFPAGYQSTYKTFFVLDRPDNKQVRVIYANDTAAARTSGNFPYGSSAAWHLGRGTMGRPNCAADAFAS